MRILTNRAREWFHAVRARDCGRGFGCCSRHVYWDTSSASQFDDHSRSSKLTIHLKLSQRPKVGVLRNCHPPPGAPKQNVSAWDPASGKAKRLRRCASSVT